MSAVEILGPITVVLLSFAGTNIDNLMLLVVLMVAEPGSRARHRAGFLLACAVVLALAALGLLLDDLVSPAYIGYLGFVPIGMGCYLLISRATTNGASASAAELAKPRGSGAGMLATALLMLGNSADSLAIFIPLVAESERASLAWGTAAYMVSAGLWVSLAGFIAGHPELRRRVGAIGERLVPLVMIGAGIYILMDTATDTIG